MQMITQENRQSDTICQPYNNLRSYHNLQYKQIFYVFQLCINLQRLLRNNNLFNCSNFGCKYFLNYTVWGLFTDIFIVVLVFIVNTSIYCQKFQTSVIQNISIIRSKTTIKPIFTSFPLLCYSSFSWTNFNSYNLSFWFITVHKLFWLKLKQHS